MSRIAIIDTAIDAGRISRRLAGFYDLCGGRKKSKVDCHNAVGERRGISHGTLCAMALDRCASEYELINIRIFDKDGEKVFGDVDVLVKALELSRELGVDVVSLSSVSSVLSDAEQLYEVTQQLAQSAMIVSALDNMKYVTVPTSFPHVVGVQCDKAGVLASGALAYHPDDPFGASVCVNCDFEFLRELGKLPSNSLAVPVTVAHINGLLNRGVSKSAVHTMLQDLPVYPTVSGEFLPQNRAIFKQDELPIVFLAGGTNDICRSLMDVFYKEQEVQSSALSLVGGIYDVRIKDADVGSIHEDLLFMERHYKTDMIFIVGTEAQMVDVCWAVEADVCVIYREDKPILLSEGLEERLSADMVAGRLYGMLTE